MIDILAERNAFGRQITSFEADFEVQGVEGGPMRGVFIRAPWIAEHGPGCRILAEVDGHPVATRQGKVLAVSFHAELTGEDRLHRSFLSMAGFEQAERKGRPRCGFGSVDHSYPPAQRSWVSWCWRPAARTTALITR